VIPRIDPVLPFIEVARLWQRASNPSSPLADALDALHKAFWRGRLDAPRDEQAPTRLGILRALYRHPETAAVIRFTSSGTTPRKWTKRKDGSVVVDMRTFVPVPAGRPSAWTDATSADAYAALADAALTKKMHFADLPREVAHGLRAKPIRFELFHAFLETYYPNELPFLAWCPPGRQLSGGAPEGSAATKPAAKNRAKHPPQDLVNRCYREWIEIKDAKGDIPAREDDFAWMKTRLPNATEKQTRAARKAEAPREWQRGGPKKRPETSKILVRKD
jgi:hypothetical protein